MSNLLDYTMRLVQYFDLTLLFGLPFFVWCGTSVGGIRDEKTKLRYSSRLSRCFLMLSLIGLALVNIEIMLNTAGIMGVSAYELVLADVAWYLLDTSAGRAGLIRTLVLLLMVTLLVWQLRHDEFKIPTGLITLLAGVALITLAWNGHAASGEGTSGMVRLVAGVAHLLAAGGWFAAIAVLLFLLVRCCKPGTNESSDTVLRALHDFRIPGTVFVSVLVVTGVLLYGDLAEWSITPLIHSQHGKMLLLKLALFTIMLGLAALHRWYLVPYFRRDIRVGSPLRSLQHLRMSVSIEAISVILILVSVAILGTLNPQG